MKIQEAEIIFYVENQPLSAAFYSKIFRKEPDLAVPGMTEFILSENCKLGMMPNSGIKKILEDKTPDPASGNGIPRCELNLYTEDLEDEFENAIAAGAKLISKIADRSWGDKVCYFADPDGHILAFAQKLEK